MFATANMTPTLFFLVIYLCRESVAFSTGALIPGRVYLPVKGSSGLDIHGRQTKYKKASNFRPMRSIANVVSSQASSSLKEYSSRSCRVTILGGGFGGLYTALNLARLARLPEQNFGKLEITLIDANDRFFFFSCAFLAALGLIHLA